MPKSKKPRVPLTAAKSVELRKSNGERLYSVSGERAMALLKSGQAVRVCSGRVVSVVRMARAAGKPISQRTVQGMPPCTFTHQVNGRIEHKPISEQDFDLHYAALISCGVTLQGATR